MVFTTTQGAESTVYCNPWRPMGVFNHITMLKTITCLYPFIYPYPHIAEMCYPTVYVWIEREVPDQPLTYEEVMIQYYDEQWEYYQELWNMVREAGGEIPITIYTRFLLDELRDRPY